MNLAALLERSAGFSVRSGDDSLSQPELVARSDAVRNALGAAGVRPGDRVGLCLHKSLEAVASIFGVLKAGAAYVPVDADSPVARRALILADCEVKAVIVEAGLQAALARELDGLGARPSLLDPVAIPRCPSVPTHPARPDDVAFLLYTSGSTGRPKGVVLTHGNALSFLDWCSATFRPTATDVFSSHAPFHFDLSVLDIYLPIRHGSKLVLLGEELGKDPLRLAAVIAGERITHWYSTPSVLSVLKEFGRLDRHDYSSLRAVLFAGEVFPVPRFRSLRETWPHPIYYNLYGPTETNVCTWYEVPADDSWASRDSFPIGRICPPNEGRVVNEIGEDVRRGEEGELVVAGPNVMRGYWNLPAETDRAFLNDPRGRRWYRTGDIVVEGERGEYTYRGRRDRMVKRRGYRVELGEVEAALMRHPDVQEVAVVACTDADGDMLIAAFLAVRPGRSPGIIGLKSYSSRSLPPYMVPDSFSVVDALPRTSTHKVDLQALKSRIPATKGAS